MLFINSLSQSNRVRVRVSIRLGSRLGLASELGFGLGNWFMPCEDWTSQLLQTEREQTAESINTTWNSWTAAF